MTEESEQCGQIEWAAIGSIFAQLEQIGYTVEVRHGNIECRHDDKTAVDPNRVMPLWKDLAPFKALALRYLEQRRSIEMLGDYQPEFIEPNRTMAIKEQRRHPNWQKMRLTVLQRDNFTCRRCGENQLLLHVHHNNYDAPRVWDAPLESLETLCEICHKQEHEK